MLHSLNIRLYRHYFNEFQVYKMENVISALNMFHHLPNFKDTYG